MADVNSTLLEVCNEIALALQVKLNTDNKFKPINYAARVLDIGSEANAVANDVKLGKKVYVGDDYVDGTFEGIDLNVSLSLVEQTFEPETGKYYKKVIVPAASAPVDVWDGTGIVIEKLVDLISFTIDGASYNAEKGSTWGEWANSEYNTVEARWVDFEDGTGMQIKVDGAYKYIYYNEQFVQDTDDIVADGAYTTTAPVTEDELQGTWVFNSTLTDMGSIGSTESWEVSFSTSAQSYAILKKAYEATFSQNQGLYFDTTLVWDAVNEWHSNTYKTITITSTLRQVIDGDFLLTWLKANATKQGAASLISFTISSTSYQAESGMTWAEWVESDYNPSPNGILVSGNYIAIGGGYVGTTSLERVLKTDVITPSTRYEILGNEPV